LAVANLDNDQESQLFELLQRKATGELSDWIDVNIIDCTLAGWLNVLPRLAGSAEVLTEAKQVLVGAPASVLSAIDQLEKIVAVISAGDVTVYLDLGELPGYHYHTGIVFAGYVQGYGKALGNGGRYDHVGEAFGRSRPATGFAFDLKSLVNLGQRDYGLVSGIFVPYTNDEQRHEQIILLRGQGNRVIQGFAGQTVNLQEIKCDRQLIQQDGQYVIQKLF